MTPQVERLRNEFNIVRVRYRSIKPLIFCCWLVIMYTVIMYTVITYFQQCIRCKRRDKNGSPQ